MILLMRKKEYYALRMVQFDTLCKNIYSLMIDQLTPIDIKISMIISGDSIKDVDTKYASKIATKFKKVFHTKKISSQYKQPICNKFCTPMIKPIVSYKSRQHSSNIPVSRDMSFHLTNVKINV